MAFPGNLVLLDHVYIKAKSIIATHSLQMWPIRSTNSRRFLHDAAAFGRCVYCIARPCSTRAPEPLDNSSVLVTYPLSPTFYSPFAARPARCAGPGLSFTA